MVRCIVGWLVAIVAALITMPAADADAIKSVRPPPVTHTYDSPPPPTADAYTHYDRGPPSVRVDVHRHGAGGPGSRGTLASADGEATTYTYDSSGQLVSVAHSVALEALKPRTTTGRDGLVLSGAVSSFPVGLVAANGGANAVRIGQAGETAVRSAFDIGPKATRVINGRKRIFDGLNSGTVSEVKNVQNLSYTRQLRDYADYASQNGLRLNIYVRGGTNISGPLARADLDPMSPVNIIRYLE